MIAQQTLVEFKKTLTWHQFIFWAFLILSMPSIKFFLVKDGYVYYRNIEVFLRINSEFVPLLFPLLMTIVYSFRFIGEQKNNYLSYVSSRISLRKYYSAKLIVNAVLSFTIAFLIVFIPFVFVMYIEPFFNIITIYPEDGNPIPLTTFEQFLSYGSLIYGLIYSAWVGINGMLYATFGILLLMILEKPLVALATPFIYYQVGNFITAMLNYDKFSPLTTIFPFSITQQPLWTVLVPFGILLTIVSILFIKVDRKVNDSYE